MYRWRQMGVAVRKQIFRVAWQMAMMTLTPHLYGLGYLRQPFP